MIRSTIITAVMLSLAGTAGAACDYPRKVDIPNGAQASKDEMLAGKDAMKTYMANMDTYLDCIEAQTAEMAEEGESAEAKAQRDSVLTAKYNAAVEEMETLAAEFNAQIRAFNAANGN